MHTFDWMLVFTIILAFTITSDTSQLMVMADCLETLQKTASMPQEWSEWLWEGYATTQIFSWVNLKTGLAINRNVAFSYIWFLWLPVSGGWHWCGTVCRNSYPWTSHRLCIAVPRRWCGDPHEESREQGPEILPHLSSSALHHVVGSGGGYGGSGVCIILRSQTESGIKRAGTAAGSQHLVNCWNRVRSRYKHYLVFPVVSLIMIFL